MRKLSPDKVSGIIVTASLHLAVIIVLLAAQIGYTIQKENSFVLDFSKQEEKERKEKQEDLRTGALEKLEEMIAAAGLAEAPKNVTVDRSSLKDDRNTDAEKLYRDAERLAEDLRNGKGLPEEEDYIDPFTKQQDRSREKSGDDKPYSGPSVLSWELTGRRAASLPVPAYKGYYGGVVKVIITVNTQGTVVDAKIDESASSKDARLREFAISAARRSRFDIRRDASSRQNGYIIYQFLAQ